MTSDHFSAFSGLSNYEDIVDLLKTEARGFRKDEVDDGNEYEVLIHHR